MAMTLAMDREPEVARFIDTYKFDQDMATKRDRFGGGTSLPLNSDGYEDKQRALRDERHKDWLVQQDKPKEPVYYRVGTPEQGFPGLGEYERQRQDKNIARQKEYNEMLKKQRHAEQQKQEARRYAPQARPAQPLGPQMDYNAAGELAKAEEKKAYQDYMGNWRTDQINAPHKPYMDYWENQRFLKEERRREYNELLEKKAKEERYWALRGRPVTPPGGLNIGQYDRQVKEQAPQKKQEYKRMLDEQKYTQLKLRAMDHAADLSSKYVRYREEERPLVGSPRDINPYMQEKESKDKFRRDLKNIPVQNHSPSSQNVNETSRDDPNYKAFMEVEKDKARDKRKYAEELLKQQKEHMFLRARQEPEMAVIDRNAQSSQFLANKPPPGPSYGRGRDESSRQTPAFWNEGKQAQGPTSLSSVASRSNQSSAYVPMTNSYSRPIPERPSHGQPPYPGRTIIQNDDQYNLAIPNRNYKPVSPEKPVDRELLKIPPKDTERPNEMGTPMAFKTDSLSQTLPEQSRNGQQFSQGEEMVGRPQSPANLPPMSPEKPINPEWLKRPVMDDELPPGVGTPLAFKTNSYANQPPPVPEQGYQRQPDYAPADDYMRQPQSPLQKRDFQGPPFSSDAHRSYRRREDGLDGTYGRPDQSERPRSRRSLDADRKQSPSKRDNAAKQNKVSPRRMKQQLYTDSEEVSLKRREASKERQKEYNDFLKLKDEKRKHESEVFQQQHGGKPAEIVKNPFYSSDDYEKFQKELKKKQEKEYSEFLSKQYQPNKDAQGLPLGQYKYEPMRLHLEAERNKEYNELLEKQNSPRVPKQVDGPQGLNIDVSYHREKQEWLEKQRNKDYNEYLKKEEEQRRFSRDGNSAPKTTCGSTFQPPSSPFRNVRQTPSPVRVRQQHRSDQMSHVLSREDTPNQRREPNIQGRLSNHEQLPNHTQTKGFEEHNGHPPYGSDHEYHNQEPMHHQMAAPYPKASSVPLRSPPATPSKLSLPVGQYDEMRPFLVKQRNKEYNSVKEKLPPLKKTGITPRATKVSLPVGQYDEERPFFEKQRNAEYNELLEKGKLGKHTFRTKVATPPSLQGLPIGQQHYDPMYRAMEHQRNREYNDFLQKKYGGNKTFRSSRSQPEKPTQPKSSFYYGNELEHEEKRKMLDDERRNDYHQFMKEQEPPRSKSIDIPTDADSGLPIGQHHHEAWRKFLREQRNSEYNQLRETKQSEKRNRNWNFDETGVLELKGDDEVQLKKRELRAERREDYNQYISQIKAPTRRNWPEPEGQDGLLVRNGEYDNVRQMYDEERKRDYNDTMRKRREMGLDLTPPSAPAEPLQSRYEYFNPMINVLGRYEDYRKKLKDDRRKDFRHHMDQVKAEDTHRRTYVNTAPTIAREETPIVNSLGLYETETKNKMRAQRKKDMEEQVHEQEKHWTPRVTVKENLMPHVADSETPLVNYMGQYDKDRLKFRLERNKELRDFSEKKKHELRNPYDHFVYPTVAVAEKPIVEYMGGEVERRKHDLREERKKEYELFKKQVASNNQKVAHPGRRHEFVDSANGPYGGLFHGLGEHGNRSDDLNRERHREYNEKLEQQYAGRDRPGGRPKWVQESLPNNTDRGRSPMKTQPPTDQYQQMLNEKRREEANMRRYEDPEYQDRLAHGRDRGEAGQRYGY
ncbi:trichohyalin-like isoform X6 [Ruditapes philippinarum]|uniref:trichohyalin-like isoform X6 n=1 Tax=Ruditapes philippinarum TaxID=129788 RepID=UPI00295B97B3|nr:trichohyalin-like isoform X6 [Ruditapes philippinarum]